MKLGFVGSVGWILWIGAFVGAWKESSPPLGTTRFRIDILKFLLLTFGIGSIFGVHSQSIEVLLTFWIFVYWLSSYLHCSGSGSSPLNEAVEKVSEEGLRRVWPGVLVILWATFYAVILGYVSWTSLRVPYRAAAMNFDYGYGFYPEEVATDDGTRFRWTAGKAVTVLPVQGPWLRCKVWAQHPDIQKRPVELQLWIDTEEVDHILINDHLPVISYLPAPMDKKRIILTIQVNRTWRPRDSGQPDDRQLGVGVATGTFLQTNPLQLSADTVSD